MSGLKMHRRRAAPASGTCGCAAAAALSHPQPTPAAPNASLVIGNATDELAGEMHGMAMTRMDALAGREL